MTEALALPLQLGAALAAARLLGRAAARAGQPAVLGELLAGVLLGALPFFGRGHEALHWLAEAGVALLLFETGMHCDPRKLLKAGPTATAVALVGVAVPFALGWTLMFLFHAPPLERLFVGAALTATSVGITARVLADLGRTASPEALVILGAAVIDDVLGVGLLTWLQTLSPSAVGGGAAAKSVVIVGAFAAGVALGASRRRASIERLSAPATKWLAPVFFVVTGAGVDLSVLTPGALGLAAALSVLAVAGKAASALAVREKDLNRWAIGFGMVPRGEVGLIFAQIGLSAGIVAPELYAAVVGMVIATTFASPPLLKKAFV